jgi:MFS family permease
MSRRPRRGALADPRFRRLLVSTSISSFGDSALYLSLGIWAKDLTGSNAATGGIFLALGLPALLAPFAGQLVDRVRRKPLLLLVNAVTGAGVLSLLLVHSRGQLWLLYAVAVLYGVSFILLSPARMGLVKDLLPDRDLAVANAAFTTTAQGLRMVSPLAGAALYAGFGGGALAILDACTFLIAIGVLATVRIRENPGRSAAPALMRERLAAGFRHIRGVPILAQVTGSAAAAMLVLGFYESVTFAVIAALGKPASFFGVLMSVQAGGSIVGGLAAARLIRRLGEPRCLGLGLGAWVVASLLYTIRSVPAAFAALAIFGVAGSLYAIALATATQLYTPPGLQGRVGATSNMITDAAQTLSIAIGAALVDTVSYRLLLLTVAVVAGLAAVPVLIRPASLLAPPAAPVRPPPTAPARWSPLPAAAVRAGLPPAAPARPVGDSHIVSVFSTQNRMKRAPNR